MLPNHKSDLLLINLRRKYTSSCASRHVNRSYLELKTAYFHSFWKYHYFMLVTNLSQMIILWYTEVMECPMYDEAVVVNVFHVASLIFLKKVPMRKNHIVLQPAPAILARQTISHETVLGNGWSCPGVRGGKMLFRNKLSWCPRLHCKIVVLIMFSCQSLITHSIKMWINV